MQLPRPSPSYDPQDQARTRSLITEADKQNLKRNADLDLTGQRFILSSPNGSKWQVTVSNAGALVVTAL
jgi:hypothetical protein